MNWTEFTEAVDDAERILRLADESANRIAHILTGRLRKVDPRTLANLKRELKDFNPQRRTWRK